MTQPAYISWLGHGTTNGAPPGVFKGITSYAFVLDASRSAMQALVDELLTPATQGKVVYRVPMGTTMVSVLDAAQCSSGPEQIGWLPGREWAVWVPLVEEHPGHPLRTRPVLWSPYIFISYDIGLVTGREVWGWPKAMGAIAVEPAAQPARFACATTIFRHFAPNAQGETAELMAITGTKPVAPGPGDLRELVSALFGDLAGDLIKLFHVEPVIPAIALKQFRDSADATRVCYQAIVNSPCRVTAMQGAQLLDDRFSLTVTTCDSHRIMQDVFGEAPTAPVATRAVRMAARMRFEFQADPGSAIVAWP